MRVDSRQSGTISSNEGVEHSSFEAPARLREYQSRALRNYQPTFYDGKVRFLRPAIPTHFPDDPVAVWAHLVKQMDVESVPSDHFEMLTTHVEEVASALTQAVRSSHTERSSGAQDR
jgi:thioesterase domain-containing protein